LSKIQALIAFGSNFGKSKIYWGNGVMGRWSNGKIGRWEDGKMGGWGDGKMG
jgi:hypothetical protein